MKKTLQVVRNVLHFQSGVHLSVDVSLCGNIRQLVAISCGELKEIKNRLTL